MIEHLREQLCETLAHIVQYEDKWLYPEWYFKFDDAGSWPTLPLLPDLGIPHLRGSHDDFAPGGLNHIGLNKAKFVEFANGLVAIYGGHARMNHHRSDHARHHMGVVIIAKPHYGWKEALYEMSFSSAPSFTLIEDFKKWILAALLMERNKNHPGEPLLACHGLTFMTESKSTRVWLRDGRYQFLYPQVSDKIVRPAVVQINSRALDQPSYYWGCSPIANHLHYVGRELPNGFHGFPAHRDTPEMRSMINWLGHLRLDPWKSNIFTSPSDEVRFIGMT